LEIRNWKQTKERKETMLKDQELKAAVKALCKQHNATVDSMVENLVAYALRGQPDFETFDLVQPGKRGRKPAPVVEQETEATAS